MRGVILADGYLPHRIGGLRRRRPLNLDGGYDDACRNDCRGHERRSLDNLVDLPWPSVPRLPSPVPPSLPDLRLPALSGALPQELPNDASAPPLLGQLRLSPGLTVGDKTAA